MSVNERYDYDIHEYKAVKGTEDFQEVIDVALGSGYDWVDLEGFYSPSKRRYFWVSGAGCSCDSLSDSVFDVDDFESGTKAELAEAVRRHHGDTYSPNITAMNSDIATVKAFAPTRIQEDRK